MKEIFSKIVVDQCAFIDSVASNENVFDDAILDFSNVVISENHIKALVQSGKEILSLTKCIVLLNNQMEDSRFSHLLDILRDKTHILESVSINHNAIGPATCTSLLNIMKRVSPQWLKEFKLDHCPMSDSTQDILAKQITSMPQLRKLTLTRFSFSMESLKLFI